MTTEPPPLARVVLRNTLWLSLGSYVLQFMGFSANLILTRLLPVETYGFFSMATFWSSQLSLRSKSGLSYAAIQRAGLDAELLGTYYGLDLALAALQFLLATFAGGVLLWLHYPTVVVVALLVLMAADSLSALVGPLNMALEKELQLSRLTLVGIVGYGLGYTVAIALAVARRDIWSLLAINSLVAISVVVGVYWVARWRIPQTLRNPWHFSRVLAKELLRHGLPTGLSLTAVLGFVSMFDNFLVGTFVGYQALGFYDRAFRTAFWPNILLTTVVGRIGFLTFARVRDDLPRLTHAVRLSLWVLVTLGVPMGLGLAFGAPEVIGVLYGPNWLQSAVYLRFIAIYALAGPFWGIGYWLAVALKDTRTSVLLTLSQAAVMLVVTAPLAWRFGVAGTLAGVGLTNAVALGLSIAYVFRKVPLSAREALLPPVVATAATVLALLLLMRAPGWPELPTVARMLAVAGVAVGAFWLVLLAVRPAEMLERVRYLGSVWLRR